MFLASTFPTTTAAPLFDSGPSPRKFSRIKHERVFNSVGWRTDRYGQGMDTLAGAVPLPDGKFAVRVDSTLRSGGMGGVVYGREGAIIRIAEDGSRDWTFGDQCKFSPSTSSFSVFWPADFGKSLLAVQPDGRLVTIYNSQLLMCDSTGRIVSNPTVGVLSFEPSVLRSQPDGKILAAGASGSNWVLIRWNENGIRDETFDADGTVSIPIASPTLQTIEVLPDGRIIVAGSSSNDFAVSRLNPDGSMDNSFGGDGTVITPIDQWRDEVFSVKADGEGRLLAAGTSLNSSSASSGTFALARYNSDGSLDESFGTGGKVSIPIVNGGTVMLASVIRSAAIQPDGRILITGHSHNGFNFDPVTLRLEPDGTVDESFNSHGSIIEPLPGSNDYKDGFSHYIHVGEAGKITTIGDTVYWPLDKDITFRRFTHLGMADPSVGSDGESSLDIGKQPAVADLVKLYNDGRVLAAGRMMNGGNFESGFIARYTHDGQLDPVFNGKGWLLTGSQFQYFDVGPELGIVTASSWSGVEQGTRLVKYNEDGSADTSFGVSGAIVVSGASVPRGLEIQPNGKILFWTPSAIYRLTNQGLLDSSFDGDGKLDTPSNGVKLQSDGTLIVGRTSGSTILVARHNEDGSLNRTFDEVSLPHSSTIIAIDIQADGKVVVLTGYGSSAPYAFFRFDPDGSLDQDFGVNGKTLITGRLPVMKYLKVQTDGTILAGSDNQFLRLTADGQLDTSFYGDGIIDFPATQYGSSIRPALFASAMDDQGSIAQVGSGSSWPTSSISTAFVGRVKVVDLRYVHFDHNGDGRADLSVFRPSTATWHVLTPQAYTVSSHGAPGDRPVPADYDADGKTDLAVFRISGDSNSWNIVLSETTQEVNRSTGPGESVPLPSDRDGDGQDDISVFRHHVNGQLATETHFSEYNSRSEMVFGVHGDRPVRGDFDGDGKADVALFRPSNRKWYIMSSAESQGFYAVQWGEDGDIPVPADYDGDGATDIAVWRPSTGQWWIRGSSAGWMVGTFWGEPGDRPVPADYDGDGKTDIAVWRPSNGTWYIVQSADASIRVEQFGEEGDIPLPNAFIY